MPTGRMHVRTRPDGWVGYSFPPFLHFPLYNSLLIFPHSLSHTDDMRKYLQKKESPPASLPASSSPSPSPIDAPTAAATATDGTAAGATSTPSSSTSSTSTSSTSGKKKRQQAAGVDLTAEDVTEDLGKMNLEGGGGAGEREANGTEEKP